jgi:hypothetical protein
MSTLNRKADQAADALALPSPLHRRGLLASIASLIAGSSILSLAGCATPAQAAYPGLATLEVFDRDSGQVVPAWHQSGQAYVPGRPGARYALRLRNNTGQRVLVVLSVDGINVVSGETADWRQVGYVLEPYRSYDINGWRKSNTEVAAFEFAAIERSYAAQTGRPGNVGVIGMAVFRERYVPPPSPVPPIAPPISMRGDRGMASKSEAAPGAAAEPQGAPAARAAAPSMRDSDRSEQASEYRRAPEDAGTRLGTAHGQREWSVSQRTHFERASPSPEQVVQLNYDSYERLVAAGIIPSAATPYASARPRPFPSNQPGFVPDPPSR